MCTHARRRGGYWNAARALALFAAAGCGRNGDGAGSDNGKPSVIAGLTDAAAVADGEELTADVDDVDDVDGAAVPDVAELPDVGAVVDVDATDDVGSVAHVTPTADVGAVVDVATAADVTAHADVTAIADTATAADSRAVVTVDSGSPPPPTTTTPTRAVLDPLPNPPSGNVVTLPDNFGQRPAFLKDNHGAGDVVGMFHDPVARRFALFDVTTGRWFLAPTQTALGPQDSNNGSQSIAQDAAGKVHFVWAQVNLARVAYARAALTRDVGGHVSGFTWEADALEGPAIGAGDWRLHLIDAVDPVGTEGLVLGLGDASQGYGVYALAKAPLAPAGPQSWTALDGAAGTTSVLRETASDTYTAHDGTQKPVTPLAAPIHQSEMAVAQHPVDRSLHVFLGARLVEEGPGTDVRRFRFVQTGPFAWTRDATANGLRLARNAVNDRTYLGSVAVSGDRIWLAYFDPNAGLRVVHSENGFGVDSGVPIPLPYTRDDGLGQAACGLSASLDNRLWIAWVQDFLGQAKSGHWNGAKWSVADAGVATAKLSATWAWGAYAVGERDGLTTLGAWNAGGKYQPFLVSIHGGG